MTRRLFVQEFECFGICFFDRLSFLLDVKSADKRTDDRVLGIYSNPWLLFHFRKCGAF